MLFISNRMKKDENKQIYTTYHVHQPIHQSGNRSEKGLASKQLISYLRSSFFITSCPIDLTTQEKSRNTFRFECVGEFSRIDVVILDSISYELRRYKRSIWKLFEKNCNTDMIEYVTIAYKHAKFTEFVRLPWSAKRNRGEKGNMQASHTRSEHLDIFESAKSSKILQLHILGKWSRNAVGIYYIRRESCHRKKKRK